MGKSTIYRANGAETGMSTVNCTGNYINNMHGNKTSRSNVSSPGSSPKSSKSTNSANSNRCSPGSSPKSTRSRTSQRSRSSRRTSFSDYDLDKLNSEIASATSPLNNSGFTSLKTHETTIKYFLASGILFPSICAVLIPTTFWSTSTIDVANLFTNSIVICLTAWAIKFTIEWPWNWFNQLQLTKHNLINYVNSTFILNQLPHEFDLEGPNNELKFHDKDLNDVEGLLNISNVSHQALNNQVFISKLLLLKKILRLEKIALVACLLLSFVGSCLMCWAREYIIVDETKKKIIFNNINIVLYQVWLMYRLILTITSNYQTHDGLNEDDSYNLLTEYNLHTFMPQSVSNPSRNTFNQFINHLLVTPEKKQPDLEKISKKQTHLISKLMTAQTNQFSSINDYLNKLDSKIQSIIPKEKNMLTPFPLSLPRTTNSVNVVNSANLVNSVNSVNSATLDTIYEHPNMKLRHPKLTVKPTNSPESFSPSNFNPTRHPFSLHGMKSISKPNKLPEDLALKFDLGYESDIYTTKDSLSLVSSGFNNSPKDVSLYSVAKHLVHTIGKKGSIRYALRNPLAVIGIITKEFNDVFAAELNRKYQIYHENTQLFKSVLWEALNKYLFSNFNSILTTLAMLNNAYLYPIRKVRDLTFVVMKLQYNLLRFYCSLLFVVPRLWLKYTVIKPIITVKDMLMPKKEKLASTIVVVPEKEEERNKPEMKASTTLKEPVIRESPFKGMKELRLSSSTCNLKRTRGHHIINGDNRTRTAALRKLSKKLNIELETNSIVRTPVRLVGASN